MVSCYPVIIHLIRYWPSNRSEGSCIGLRLAHIGPVTGLRSAVLAQTWSVLAQLQIQGQLYWPLANTADLGPVTGPIQNHVINAIFIK